MKKGELTEQILLIIGAGLLVSGALVAPNIGLLYKYFLKNKLKKDSIYRSLYRAQKADYVKIVEKGGEQVVELTEKGRKRVLDFDFEDLTVPTQKKWDKKWRVVMFDIKEEKKKYRNFINFKLKDMGFIPLQKSVFVTPYECKDRIDYLRHVIGLSGEVIFMEVTYLSQEQKLLKHFNLS